MRCSRIAAGLFFSLVPVGAAAQSDLNSTFDQIGASLDGIQRSLGSGTGSGPVVATKPVEVWADAGGTIPTGLQLEPNTQVQVINFNDPGKFAELKVVGWPEGATVWADKANLEASIGDRLANAASAVGIQQALEQVKNLAIMMQTNPYVRIEGFSVSISASPGVDIDFEMLPFPASDGAAAQP